MPKHNNLDIYPFDPSIDARDGVFGFDYNTGGKSKNFKMEHLRYFILQGLDPSNNGFVTTTGYTLVDNILTINAGWQWLLNGLLCTNEEDVVFTLEYTAEGFVRIDSIYANSNNELLLTSGGESETIAVPPQIPINTLLAFSINIFDSTIVTGEDTVLGSIYVKKSFSKSTPFNGSGSDVIIPLNSNGYSNIVLINPSLISVCGIDLSLIAGVTSAENPFEGKLFLFKNQTGNSVTFKNGFGVDYPFLIKGGADLILPNGEYLLFSFENDYMVDVRNYIDLSKKADLVDGKVPAFQLPSYVDDVLEFTNLAAFPATGEAGKIYLALDTNFTYRWTGSVYLKISDTGKLDKVTTNDVEKVYIKNADGTQGMKPTSEFGGSDYLYKTVEWVAFRLITQNTWKMPVQMHDNFPNTIIGDWGTSTLPERKSGGHDQNGFAIPDGYIIDKIQLEVDFKLESYYASQLQVYIKRIEATDADLSDNTTNTLDLVNQIVSIGDYSSIGLKFTKNLTVASHSLPTLARSFVIAGVRETGVGNGYLAIKFNYIFKKI